MFSQEELDALPIIDDYTPTPSYGGSMPTMDIKNSYQGSFADMYAPAVIQQESGGQAHVEGPMTRYGERAQGLMQLMPATGREMAGKLGMQNFDPFDAQQNEVVGKAYLNQMYEKFQNPELAFAAYNAGPNRVQGVIDRIGSNDPAQVLQYLPKETQDYVPKVLGNFNQNAQVQGQESDYAKPNQVNQQPFYSGSLSQDEFDALPIIQDETAPHEELGRVEPPQPEMGWGDYIEGLGGQALNSATFNLGDNVSSAYKKLPNLLQDALGSMPGMGSAKDILGGDLLDTQKLKEFRKENPKASLAAALSGALVQPASLVSSLPRAAGSAVVYGFGDKIDETTDPTDLGVNALKDALLGSTGYGVAKVIGKGVSALGGPKLSGGEKVLSKRLKDVPDDALQGAQTVLKESSQPMFLPEALQTEDLFRQAKTIANSPDTKDIAQALIKARKDAQPARLNSVLDEVAELRNPAEAGAAIKTRASEVLDALNAEKNLIAKKTYSPVYKATPAVSEDLLADLLRSPNAQSAAKSLRRSREYMDYPENSTEFLHAVKSALSTKAQAATDGTERRLLSGDADYLRQVLNEKVSGLADADQVYTKLMEKIGDVGEDSLLGLATRKGDLNVSELGSKILSSKTDPKQVQKLIKDLGDDGEELVLGAVRAKLSDDIANRVSGNNTVNMFDKVAVKERLTDIMGAEKAYKVLKKLEDEVIIAKGTNRYKIGSDTASNKDAANSEMKLRNVLKYYGMRPIEIAGDIADASIGKLLNPSRKSLQSEAETIFSNDKSIEALIKILSKRESNASISNKSDLLGALLTRAGQSDVPVIEIKNSFKGAN